MVKRCIGIDVGSSHLRAVQLLRTGDEFCIEKAFSVPIRRNTDSPPDILKTLVRRDGFDQRADIAISMPHDAVFFRNVEIDSASAEQIRARSSAALNYNFPIPPDEIAAQPCSYRQLSGDKYSVLIAGTARTSLRERVNLVAGAKMRPNVVEAAIFAIHSTVALNHPEIRTGTAIIAYVDERHLTLAITENNDILIVRNIPVISCSDPPAAGTDSAQKRIAELLSREAQITWQKVFGREIKRDSKIYLVAADAVAADLEAAVKEKLRCQTVAVDPYAKLRCSIEHNGDAAICLAEGLALRVLAPDETTGINFLEADNANTKPTLNLKKQLLTCVILVAAIALVLLAGLFVRLASLETKYAHIKNELRQTFQTTLPEEKNIVSPLAQLEQKLQSFRKDYQLFASFCPTVLAPLEVLRNIAVNTPEQGNVKVDDLLITAESVRLNGTCDSFEAVYQWQRLLQDIPDFALVDVQDVQTRPGGQSGEPPAVRFTILISPEQK